MWRRQIRFITWFTGSWCGKGPCASRQPGRWAHRRRSRSESRAPAESGFASSGLPDRVSVAAPILKCDYSASRAWPGLWAPPPWGCLRVCGPVRHVFWWEGREEPQPEPSRTGSTELPPCVQSPRRLPGPRRPAGRPRVGFPAAGCQGRSAPEASPLGTTVVEVTSGEAEEAHCDSAGSKLQGPVLVPVPSLSNLIRATFSSPWAPLAPWVTAAPPLAPSWDVSWE